MSDPVRISTDQLRIGLYVFLDLKWFEHPFAFNAFKIKSDDQIKTLLSLGLKSILYDPERSDLPMPEAAAAPSAATPRAARPSATDLATAPAQEPAPQAAPTGTAEATPAAAAMQASPPPGAPACAPGEAQAPGAASPPASPAVQADRATAEPVPAGQDAASAQAEQTRRTTVTVAPEERAAPSPAQALLPTLAAKRALIEKIRQQRETAARLGTDYVNTTLIIRDINKDLFTKPVEKVRQATQLVNQIAGSILSAPELALHLMTDKAGGEEMYFHSLTVTMLSLMMARDIKLPPEHITALGLGALFHDIGRTDIPSRILMKKEALTHAEQELYKMHCQYGVEIAERLQLSPAAISIVAEHHEMYDGSGYPKALAGERIKLLPRIVAITNHYDMLCNPSNAGVAMTPHEALSLMFTKQRGKFDPKLLQVFVRCLGVYPPGTIVQLSNGVVGMVVTINASKPLKPTVMIYDADIPKDEAILVDMETETDVNIAKAIKPAQLPREAYSYLNPRQNVSYYFDAGETDKGKTQ